MKMIVTLLLLSALAVSSCKRTEYESPVGAPQSHQVLVFSKTAGFRHESIEAGIEMFRQQAAGWHVVATFSEDASQFSQATIENYEAVVLLNTTGRLFNDTQQAVLEKYVIEGGAILGIHAAADAEYDWPWYEKMLGGRFKDHPEVQTATCNIAEQHLSTIGLPERWERTDEWYNFNALQPDNTVTITIDEATYSGGSHGNTHSISWYRTVGKGRVYYTAMGHTEGTFAEPLFIEHIGGALKWLFAE